MHDLIIVGGGAAALAATSYALGKQLDVLVIYEQLGGKTGQHFTLQSESDHLVSNILVNLAFPSEQLVGEAQFAGEETVHLFERQIKARSGVAMRDRVLNVARRDDAFQIETERHGYQHSTALLIATGVAPRTLDVRGAREFLGLGLSYSATTYARLLNGKTVAVIGSNDRTLQGVAELARTVAQVYLIWIDPEPNTSSLMDLLRRTPTVEVIEQHQVLEVRGTSAVEQVLIERDGQQRALDVDAAFVEVGLKPMSSIVHDLVKMTADGFIEVNERNETSLPGLFAAGDVTTAFGEQVLIAIGEGARAAHSAYRHILEKLLARTYAGLD